LRASDVFLDASIYQAFGRTGLEAMACGCTSILPRTGGVGEYAIDGENALLVDTTDLEATYAALAGLARDPERVAMLQASAVLTAKRYSVMGAALSEYTLFAAAHRRRVGTRRASQVGIYPVTN
jgi:glycosyltransferase involved in cell wall biosynthesis